MTKVFVSYKRSDCGAILGYLYDRLCSALGRRNVFLDVTQIEGGQDFAAEIDRAISDSDVLILLVGKSWLEPSPPADVIDWVRTEVEASLRSHLYILPLLIDGIVADAIGMKLGRASPVTRLNALPMRREFLSSDADLVITAISRILKRPDWQDRQRERCLQISIKKEGERTRVLAISRKARADWSTIDRQPGLLESLLRCTVSEGWSLDAIGVFHQLILPLELRKAIAASRTISFNSNAISASLPMELMCQPMERYSNGRLQRYRAVVRHAFPSAHRSLICISPSNLALALYIEMPAEDEYSPPRWIDFVEAELASHDSTGQHLLVKKLITSNMPQVISAIFQQSYRVIFMSGWASIYSSQGAIGAGLGQSLSEAVLTGQVFSEMEYPPRLVFVEVRGINNNEASAPNELQDTTPRWCAYSSLCTFAEGFATELLKAGVTFVVVYSAPNVWNRTARFVSLLWRRLLKGDTFGAAVAFATTAFFRGFSSQVLEYPPLCFGDPTLTYAPPEANPF